MKVLQADKMLLRFSLSLIIVFCVISVSICEDCSNFDGEMGCRSGSETRNPPEWDSRQFQTPMPNTDFWRPEYEYLSYFTCYANLSYSNSSRQSGEVTVSCRKYMPKMELVYSFDNGDNFTYSPKTQVDSKNNLSPMKIIVAKSDNLQARVTLEDIDFVWNNAPINQSPEYKNGQKGAIVELFGWPYNDVKRECETIAKSGWMGIKIFPPQESVYSEYWPQNGELNPWFFLYQPVSYKLTSRLGTRAELREMIHECRSLGLRVYADAVVNHMSGGGNDVFPSHRNGNGGYCAYWGAKNSTAGSPYYTFSFTYQNDPRTGERPGMEFPAVPYGPLDFHCNRGISSWSDGFILNYGWLVGLSDLDTESEYVRKRIVSYMTDLLSIGFSGFRMDAAKHIQPESIAAILKLLKDNLGGELPEDFITWLEVIIGGEKDLLMCSDNWYNFGASFENKMKEAGLTDSDIYKVKIWSSDYPKEFPICGYWPIPSERYAVQLDCHDDQKTGSSSRDMGDKGTVLIIAKDVEKHRNFNKELFERTDGNWQIKLVLSSYTFMNNGAEGFPDGKSDCSICKGDQCNSCNKSMPYSKAYDKDACGYTCVENGAWKEGVYTRVHRDVEIINSMRNWMGLGSCSNLSDCGLPQHCGNSNSDKLSFLEE